LSTQTKIDDLDAVRIVVDTLKQFQNDEQVRIIKWAAEKLNITISNNFNSSSQKFESETKANQNNESAPNANGSKIQDIRTFIAEKKPQSDIQFAAAVAYYYQFVAPPDKHKGAIGKEDLLTACREANYRRVDTKNTFNNAHNAGLLDRVDRGMFSINNVGENLVAMTLPGQGAAVSKQTKPRSVTKPRKPLVKKPSKKHA
jgi:hypothetical protein